MLPLPYNTRHIRRQLPHTLLHTHKIPDLMVWNIHQLPLLSRQVRAWNSISKQICPTLHWSALRYRCLRTGRSRAYCRDFYSTRMQARHELYRGYYTGRRALTK